MQDPIDYAIALANAGRRGEASIVLRKALSINPRAINGWKWLAYCTNNPREALEAVYRVERLDPDDPWVWEAIPQYEALAGVKPSRRHRSRQEPHPASARGVISAIAFAVAALILAAAALFVVLRTDTVVTLRSLVAPVNSAALDAAPRLETTVTTETYDFTASTQSEIQEKLFTSGPQPVEGQGGHSIAVTNYQLWVTWKTVQSVTGCSIGDVTVHLDLHYTYPRWITMGQPSDDLLSEWHRFSEHVIAHEEHHGEIARACANELLGAMVTFDPGPTCTDAQSQLDAVVNDLYVRCENQQQTYDLQQGRTTFPLP